MLPPQISEIRLIAIELATVPEARDRAEKILSLIEEAVREAVEARIAAFAERHEGETNATFSKGFVENRKRRSAEEY